MDGLKSIHCIRILCLDGAELDGVGCHVGDGDSRCQAPRGRGGSGMVETANDRLR